MLIFTPALHAPQGRGHAHAQRGIVLISALIFLILLTLLGLAVSRNTTTEEKLARNFRDYDLAFSAAEAALRDAELVINGYYANPASPVSPYGFNSTCSGGLCDATVAQPIYNLDFYGATAPGSNSVALGSTTGSPTLTGLIVQPRYLIETVCRTVPGEALSSPSGCQTIYRITAQARGRIGSAVVTLQETYIP